MTQPPAPESLPAYLQIEAAADCNLRCEMCAIRVRRDNRTRPGPAVMPPGLFRAVIDQFEGLERLHLQGLGEPLLSPHFFGMVDYAAQKGISVSVSSNLSLLDPAGCEALVETGLQCLHVSVDGASRDTYESIRAGASFSRLLANLDLLVATKERLGSSLPSVRMTVVLMRRNLRELPDLVRLAAGFGMEQVFVQGLCHAFLEPTLPAYYAPMRDFVRREALWAAPDGEVLECFRVARETAASRKIDLRLPGLRPGREGRPPSTGPRCEWPWTGMYVSYQGSVMPCCMVSTPDRINFGSARREPLSAIWRGDAYRAFRSRLSSADPPDICASCSVYTGTF